MSTKLSDRASIEAIIGEMSLAEKAEMVIGGSPFRSAAMPKYGIPSIYMLDGCNGISLREVGGEAAYLKIASEMEASGKRIDRESLGSMGGLLMGLGALQQQLANKPATRPPANGAYPTGIVLGSAWNPEIAEEIGSAVAKEMNAIGVDMILGPNINIHRDPLCGRLSESFSEDPFLVSALAPKMVKGIQDAGLIADIKHFAANNQETDRMEISEYVPERALREIYLPGFRACVQAGCKTVMAAYNGLNGEFCAQNKWLLTDILRGEWGFEGFVVSDWAAAYDQIKTIAAGCDLTMPGPRGINEIVRAVENDKLDVLALDNCVRNLLRVILDAPAMTGAKCDFSLDESIKACEKAAAEGIIILKNDGALPLPPDSHVAFFGRRSREFAYCGDGACFVPTRLATNPFDRAKELLGEERCLFQESDCDTEYWIATVGADGHEGADRENLEIGADEKRALETAIRAAKAAGGKLIVIVNAAGPVDLSEWEADISAIICPFLPGMMGGKVTADAIFGLINPSGKLPLTWPKRYSDCPSYRNFPGENKTVIYGEGIFVGYRWYDDRRIEPEYPFGYGLSYTDFSIVNVDAPDVVNVDNGDIEVSVTVRNTGAREGSEVVQLYVHDVESTLAKPYKELKGFAKLHLEPGEEKTAVIRVGKRELSSYCLEKASWTCEPGEYDLLIGTSAANIAATKRVLVKCKNPFGLTDESSVGAVAANDAAVKFINDVISDDIVKLAAVALQFAPDTPWKAVWNGSITKMLLGRGAAQRDIDAMRARVVEMFEEL